MARSGRKLPEVNSSSMADIAFLLLVFFLVTTTIATDKGLTLTLPPKADPNQPPPDITKNERNIFKILVNSSDRILIEDEPVTDLTGLRDQVKEFMALMLLLEAAVIGVFVSLDLFLFLRV